TAFQSGSAAWPEVAATRRARTTMPEPARFTPNLVMTTTSLACVLALHPADREVVEGRDGIRLRPEPDATRSESRISMVEEQRAVEPGLHPVADGHDPQEVPLRERRLLHGGRGDLSPAAIVGVQPEVVLQRVRPDDVVLAAVEAEDDPSRGIFAAGHR